MKVTRRMVLATSAGLAAAGALGVGGIGLRWWDRPAGEGLTRLSQGEHEFAQAMAEAWMPPGGDPALSGAEAKLGVFLDEVLQSMEPGTAREMKLLLHLLDDLTLPTDLAPFRRLTLERRIERLGGWLRSDLSLLRSGVQGVLILMATGYTTHPGVVERLRPMYPCGYGR